MTNRDEKKDLMDLAEKLTPLISQKLMGMPTIYGDSKRLNIARKIGLNNTLFNTMSGDITVEDDVCFGHNVCLLTGTHDIHKKGRARIETYPKNGRDIIVHRGVWLASNVTVLGPCEIGENSVIAAGSLVISDIKSNCVYAGTPAKFIKEIDFDSD